MFYIFIDKLFSLSISAAQKANIINQVAEYASSKQLP